MRERHVLFLDDGDRTLYLAQGAYRLDREQRLMRNVAVADLNEPDLPELRELRAEVARR